VDRCAIRIPHRASALRQQAARQRLPSRPAPIPHHLRRLGGLSADRGGVPRHLAAGGDPGWNPFNGRGRSGRDARGWWLPEGDGYRPAWPFWYRQDNPRIAVPGPLKRERTGSSLRLLRDPTTPAAKGDAPRAGPIWQARAGRSRDPLAAAGRERSGRVGAPTAGCDHSSWRETTL